MLNALRPLLLLTAFIVVMPAVAQEGSPPPVEIRSQREDAGARIRQVERAGGRVLQAEPMQRGGQEVYRFKVLTPEGRVRVLQGDPGERPDTMRPARDPRFAPSRDARFEDPREPGFDRRDELTARRRDLRDDRGAERAREREQRAQMRRAQDLPQPPRAAGEPAGN
jgi:hypothetical protein